MSDWLLDKVLPSVVAGVVAGAIALWTLRKSQQFQKEQAEKAQQFQKEQAEKAVTVEKHTQAFQRCKQILWLKGTEADGEGWVKFMQEMQDWFDGNRFYLTPVVAKAFGDALAARVNIDSVGTGPEVAHIKKEQFALIRNAEKTIRENTPHYGS